MGIRILIYLIKIRAKNLFDKLNRTKTFTNATTTPLRRCLTMFDIVFLGIGHMVGAGLYNHTGTVIRETTGPSIFLSYLLAGVAAFLAALCYAELEGRIPTAGSAYTFTYVTIGELWAFLVGWSMLLENVVGAAALGTAWSSTFDYLIDNKISTMIVEKIGTLPNHYIFGSGTGPDFLGFALVIIVSLMICLGSRRSANFNTAFAVLNLLVMAFVVTYGMWTKADFTLWTDADKCPRNCSNLTMVGQTCNVTSAFLPYGPTSIIEGASQVFFAYIGFNCIASAGEETKLPQRSLPWGTMISLGIVTVAYVTMSATLTLLVPYCDISDHIPFPKAFFTSSKFIYYFISIGSLSAMTTVLFGNLFVIPRTVYSMASDGVLFKIFRKIYSKTQVPIVGVLLFGTLAAVLAVCFKSDVLMEMTSLGTLLAYSIVASCVILLRYKEGSAGIRPTGYGETGYAHNDVEAGTLKQRYSFLANTLNKVFPPKPTPIFILLMIPFLICISVIVVRGHGWWSVFPWWCILITILLGVYPLILLFLIFAHRASNAKLHFKVPLVPFIPIISLFLNIMLMVNMKSISWLRFAVWLLFGIAIYLAYGLNHSREQVVTSRPLVAAGIPEPPRPVETVSTQQSSYTIVNGNPIPMQTGPDYIKIVKV